MTPTSSRAIPNETPPIRFRERVRSRNGDAEVFVFRVGDELFGCDVKSVDEVLESPTLYPVPGANPAIVSVCQHAGRTMSVVAGSHLLGVDAPRGSVALVMRRAADRVGVLVDDVDDVQVVDLAQLHAPPFEDDDLLLAVHWEEGRLLSVIDARALVNAISAATAVSRN